MALVGTGLGASSLDWNRCDSMQAGVERPGLARHRPWRTRDHLATPVSRPVRLDRYRPDGTDRQKRQRVGIVAAVDLEPGWGLGYQRRRGRRVAGRVLDPQMTPVAAGSRTMTSASTLRPVRTGMS